jgi:hypothetical protein
MKQVITARALSALTALLLPFLLALPAFAAEESQFIPPGWVAWLFVGLSLGLPVLAFVWFRRK